MKCGVYMKNKIMFSIIVPAYNCEKYLEKTIINVLGQTYTNFELIIVNDGSKDKTYNIMKEYQLKDKRVKIYNKKNTGAGLTRNYGLSKAKGQYIFFLDADDLIEDNTLELLYNKIKVKQWDIILFGYDNFYDADSYKSIKYIPNLPRYEYHNYDIKNELIPRMIINLKNEQECNVHFSRMMIIKKKVIDNINWKFISEKEYESEDVISLYNLFLNIDSVKILKNILYHYRINDSSITHTYDSNFYIKCDNMYGELSKIAKCNQCDNCEERFSYLYFSYIISNLKLLFNSNDNKYNNLNNIRNSKIFKKIYKKYNYLNTTSRKIFFWCLNTKLYFMVRFLIKLNGGKYDNK